MSDRLSRRNFLTSSAISGGALATAWHVNPTAVTASNSSLEKINIAAIGTGNRAAADIAGCASQNIVALADIDSNFLGAAGEKTQRGAQVLRFPSHAGNRRRQAGCRHRRNA